MVCLGRLYSLHRYYQVMQCIRLGGVRLRQCLELFWKILLQFNSYISLPDFTVRNKVSIYEKTSERRSLSITRWWRRIRVFGHFGARHSALSNWSVIRPFVRAEKKRKMKISSLIVFVVSNEACLKKAPVEEKPGKLHSRAIIRTMK